MVSFNDSLSTLDLRNRSKKLTRGRSSAACASCHRRKVRCDVTTKNHPVEKCTNCFEFGIDCIVKERKNKRNRVNNNKHRHKSSGLETPLDSNRSDSPQSSTSIAKNDDFLPSLIQDAPLITDSTITDTQAEYYVPEEALLLPNYSDVSPSKFIHVDPRIGVKYDPLYSHILREHFISISSFSGIKSIAADYIQSRKDSRYLSCQSDQVLKTLINGEVFVLPDEVSCRKYIEGYFVMFHPLFPIVDKTLFLRDYKDLRNPPSLLLLRTILYIGSRVLSFSYRDKVKMADSEKENSVLYHKAKLLYDYNIETSPIPLVTSIFLLGCDPIYDTCLKTTDDFLTESVKLVMFYNMHKDQTDSKLLTTDEKKCYKTIFWIVFYRDRSLSLLFSKKYQIDLKHCTVKFLTYQDVAERHLSRVDTKRELWDYYSSVLKLAELIGEIAEQEETVDNLVSQGSPFNKNLIHMDNLINACISNLPSKLKFSNESSGNLRSILVNVFHLQLSLNVHLHNITRKNKLVKKLVNGSHFLTCNVFLTQDSKPNSKEWYDCFSLAHSICRIAKPLKNHIGVLNFIHIILGIVYQSAVCLISFLYHNDSEIREAAREGLDQVKELLDLAGRTWLQTGKWPMIDMCKYIFEVVYPDEGKRIEYVRDFIDAVAFETILNAPVGSIDPIVKKVFHREVAPFNEFVLNYNRSMAVEDFEMPLSNVDNQHAEKINGSDHDLLVMPLSHPNDSSINLKSVDDVGEGSGSQYSRFLPQLSGFNNHQQQLQQPQIQQQQQQQQQQLQQQQQVQVSNIFYDTNGSGTIPMSSNIFPLLPPSSLTSGINDPGLIPDPIPNIQTYMPASASYAQPPWLNGNEWYPTPNNNNPNGKR